MGIQFFIYAPFFQEQQLGRKMKAACTYFSQHLLLDQALATHGLRACCSSSSS